MKEAALRALIKVDKPKESPEAQQYLTSERLHGITDAVHMVGPSVYVRPR